MYFLNFATLPGNRVGFMRINLELCLLEWTYDRPGSMMVRVL